MVPGNRPHPLPPARVALPRDHAAIAFFDVGVGFAGRADSCCISRRFSGSSKFMYQHP
jgi:hypothetical protein